MERNVFADSDRCSGCGCCVEICPTASMFIEDGKARFKDKHCILCGHCLAVCPSKAIEIRAFDKELTKYETFEASRGFISFGDGDLSGLAALMASRRSCRRFLDRPVDLPVLRDLVRIGVTAPSATNSQRWTFTLVRDRASIEKLTHRVAGVFRKLNSLAASWFVRNGLRVIGRDELFRYHRDYYPMMRALLAKFDETGYDFVFRGAPAAILIGSLPGASHPGDDALLAAQNILLAAHAMGLGTCLIGIAVAAVERDTSLRKSLGLAEGENIHAIIALGYPDIRFLRTTGRLKPLTRVWETD